MRLRYQPGRVDHVDCWCCGWKFSVHLELRKQFLLTINICNRTLLGFRWRPRKYTLPHKSHFVTKLWTPFPCPEDVIFESPHIMILNDTHMVLKGCHFKWEVFEAKFLARLCCYLKRYRQTWLYFKYLVHEENTGSHDPKINVLPLGLCVEPSNNHLHKTANLKKTAL